MDGIRMRPARRRLLLALALWWWPGSRAAAQAADLRGSPEREAGVDPDIRPGDDFFGFANGGWLRTAAIPAGRELWSARTEIGERTS